MHSYTIPTKPTLTAHPIHHPILVELERVLQFVADQAELHINFDPRKMVTSLSDKGKSISILQGFCESGRYMTLFDIGTGGGCTDLKKRRGWERRMFGPVYDGFDTERPRYGNLNLMAHITGDKESSDYGKSYLLLKKRVRERCTVTSCDSCNENAVLGTLDHSAHVLLDAVQHVPTRWGRRKKFLRQLDQLVKWGDTESFPKVDAKLAR